MKETDKRWTVS